MAVNSGARTGIQSVNRALDLLEHVGSAGEVGVTQLAHELNLATSTAHNLLRTLAQRGYLLVHDGRYRLGPGVTVLAAQWDPVQALPSLLAPQLKRVAQQTGQGTFARVLVGMDAQLIGFELGAGPVTTTSPRRSSTRALRMPTGRILVAFGRRTEWDQFIAAASDVEPTWSATDWHHELIRIAQSGISVRYAGDTAGQTAIAIPVWGKRNSVVCSIACSVPGFLATPELEQRMLDALWAATADLSPRLGCARLPLDQPPVPQRPISRQPSP